MDSADRNIQLFGGFWADLPQAIMASYLPLVVRHPTPTPTVTPGAAGWQRLGNAGMTSTSLAIQGGQLFMGDSRLFASGGGLYQRTLTACDPAPPWTRLDAVSYSVWSIVFQGSQGALAAYADNGMFYSNNSGNVWSQTQSQTGKPRTVASASGNLFFAGTEEDGVYRSDNGGETWVRQSENPTLINVVASNVVATWIGADAKTNGNGEIIDDSQAGVWKLFGASNQPTQVVNGLTGKSRQIWDFAFRTPTEIYIATYDGVYRGNGSDAWQRFGLADTEVLSLEIVSDRLYAGARDPGNAGNPAGVWVTTLAQSDWSPVVSDGWDPTATVRDLLYDGVHCVGLLAATNDGVWVYR
jgi:hypothetical protein